VLGLLAWILFCGGVLLPVFFWNDVRSASPRLNSLLNTTYFLEEASVFLTAATLVAGFLSLRAKEPRRGLAIAALVLAGVAVLVFVGIVALTLIGG
jgi:hypothetical protein